ncbi:MAG: hypothetical protein ABH821_06325 [archaeon]
MVEKEETKEEVKEVKEEVGKVSEVKEVRKVNEFKAKVKLNPLIPRPKTSFIKVKCSSCGNVQTIFSNPSTKVKCLVCDHSLGESTSSKIKLNSKVLKVAELKG